MSDFLASPIGVLALTVAQTLALLVPVLFAVAYLTWAERKVLGAMQMRRGPNVVGPFGMGQPFADAIKMLMKETIIPSGASRNCRRTQGCVAAMNTPRRMPASR